MIRRWLLLALWLIGWGAPGTAAAPPAPTARDTLLITPTSQGVFSLPATGVTLDLAYATVEGPTRLAVTRQGDAYRLAAADASGRPVALFALPLLATLPLPNGPLTVIVNAPGALAPDLAPAPGAPLADRWLVVFDAHGLYAVPAWAALPDAIEYLGPLEPFTPDLITPGDRVGPYTFAASPPVQRRIIRTGPDGGRLALPSAARAARYRVRFAPEDLGNPGGFALLGSTTAERLPALVRALRGAIPHDPDLPPPGEGRPPLPLILPFDCAADWAITWGFHHSTPQARFAVDFAPLTAGGAQGQPVYAAHAGAVWLKPFGGPDRWIDLGLAARVVAPDGVTRTVYGHLDPDATLARWGLTLAALRPFEWFEVGAAAQGAVIGAAGRTGYATGAHIHFALWSWDQSLIPPVPLGPLTSFARGQVIPAARRAGCELYRQ